LKDRVKATRKELKEYYRQHQEDFRTPPRRRAEYITVDLNDYWEEVKVTPPEVEDYYYAHRETYRSPKEIRARHILIQTDPRDPEAFAQAREELESILANIKAGSSFAALARKYSQDPGSAEAGGDLGYFKNGEMPKPFEEVAFSLKPGEVSELVHTRYGYHIIKVEDIKETTTRSLSEVEGLITEILHKQKAQELARKRAEQIHQQILAGKSLEQIALGEGITLIETFPFVEGEEIAGIADSSIFSRAAFSLEVGKPSPIVSGDECFYLLRVVKEEEPRVPELSEVKDKVKESLLQEKARDLARERAERILRRLRQGKAIRSLLIRYGLKQQETGWFSPYEDFIPEIGGSEEIIQTAGALTQKTPFPDKVIEYQDRFYLPWLKERQEADKEKFSEEKEVLIRGFLELKREEFRQRWLDDLKGKARMDFNEELIRTLI
jgi:peptidyl-prolyl cis-trans isomerase D